jgi:[protein-PII] uridylyltransferase
MNETGVLGRFIPEFGRVVAMMQFNRYHHFTVDEHLIRTVGVLADLEAGRLSKAELPLSHSVLPTIASRRGLFVAAFLHDVAKRRPEDHAIGGARIARRLCPRFGLDAAETDTVAWLIEHHLLMSGTAQGRDLADPKTIEAFAAIVQTLERLKLLLILTVCDIQAVGPGVWNNWKGELLRTLYYETEVVLTGGHSAIERRERVNDSQRRLRAQLADWDDGTFEAYVARHYPPYWLRVDPARQVTHARFLAASEGRDDKLATRIDTDAFRGVTELTVLAPDHPRLLSIIAGACALSGANIVDAHIYTTTDGFALDTIFVSRAFERDEDELRRAGRIADTIEKALRGEVHTGRALAARKPARRADRTFNVTPQVIIDNTLSNRHTVIEMSGLDRPGLLHDLTTSLSKLSLNIGSAHISTIGERAVDVFYVTDLTGGKIASAGRQAQIRRQLISVLSAASPGEPRTPASEQRNA